MKLNRYTLERKSGGGAAVTPAEVKDHLGLPATSVGHDASIAILIEAATRYVEDKIGRSLIDTSWLLGLEQFPTADLYAAIVLPKAAVSAVTVNYFDAADTLQGLADVTLSAGTPHLVTPDSGEWPETRDRLPDTVQVSFTSGHGLLVTDVPEVYKLAVLQVVSDWFEFRGHVVAGTILPEVPGPTMAFLTQLAWGSEFENYAG